MGRKRKRQARAEAGAGPGVGPGPGAAATGQKKARKQQPKAATSRPTPAPQPTPPSRAAGPPQPARTASLAMLSSNWKAVAAGIPKHKGKRRKDKAASGKKIWFDGVHPDDIEGEAAEELRAQTKQHKAETLAPIVFAGETKHVAMDCEMVGTGDDGEMSILARVSIVNRHGAVLYDTHVKPTVRVTDYRTHVSGIRPEDLVGAPDFNSVQTQVTRILKGKVLVGHALSNDLQVLFLPHPKRQIRDTTRYRPFRALAKGRTPSLKKLSEALLGVKVQDGEHSSVEDARAAMAIYRKHHKDWERTIRTKRADRKADAANPADPAAS